MLGHSTDNASGTLSALAEGGTARTPSHKPAAIVKLLLDFLCTTLSASSRLRSPALGFATRQMRLVCRVFWTSADQHEPWAVPVVIRNLPCLSAERRFLRYCTAASASHLLGATPWLRT